MKTIDYLKPIKPNFFQKIFGITPVENAFIELNNLIASNQSDISNITMKDVEKISERYKVNIRTKFMTLNLELFKSFVLSCLDDELLNDNDILQIEHLKNILLLDDEDANKTVASETEKIYEKKTMFVLSKGSLDNNDKLTLNNLRSNLLISENQSNEIFNVCANQFLTNYINEVLANERVSPENEKKIIEIIKNFGIKFSIDSKKEELLERYKLYWKLENEELPVIKSDIIIQKSEKLHFRTNVKWLEQRRITKRINYGGPTARIKIAKGLYYRIGSLSVQRATEDIWQTIDSGQLFLTNKRLIFMGSSGNKTIRLNSIIDFKPYTNGVDIQKETGKSPFLEFYDNVDLFALTLSRLMQSINS